MANAYVSHRSAYFIAALLLAGCVPTPAPRMEPDADLSESRPTSETYVYRCEENYRFSARFMPDSVQLTYGRDVRTLPQVVSASGIRYSADDVTFWGKGLEATFETPRATYQSCLGQLAPTPWVEARLLDLVYRGVGQEPGWYVRINRNDIHLALDYATRHLYAPVPEPVVDRAAGTYTYSTYLDRTPVIVVITREPCQDSMSGEEFPTSVTARVGGEEFQGCGWFIDDLPTAPLVGTEWVLSEIGNHTVSPSPDGGVGRLRFHAEDARITGFSGCNNVMGGYVIEGDRLEITEPLAMTRMACVDPVRANQEEEFVEALHRVSRYDIVAETLTMYDGGEVLARFIDASVLVRP